MIIRKAKIEDCSDCEKLAKIPEFRNASGYYPRIEWMEAFVKEGQIFLVAEEGKETVGFVMGERTAGNLGLLHLIVVKKEHRSKHAGKKLLEAFEEECRKRKLIVSYLYGFAGNSETIEFFEKNGYHKGELMHEMGKLL